MKKILFAILILSPTLSVYSQDIEKLKSFEKQFIQGVKPSGDEVVQVIYDDFMQSLSVALSIKDYKIELNNIGYKYYTTDRQRNYDIYINCEKKIILNLRPQWNGILIIELMKSDDKNMIEPLIKGCENK